MPYYHTHCMGRIKWIPFLPIRPKCEKCGKTWSWLVQYGPRRRDMFFSVEPRDETKKATYAKWADSIPGAAAVASRLPNWPKWMRILFFLVIVATLGAIVFGLLLLFGRI
jgi:hypothetical protein